MPPQANSVPVLMYHRIIPAPRWSKDHFLGTHVKDFHRQMRALAFLGYQSRCFREIVEAHSNHLALPRRTVSITFDDGYRCTEEVALPILSSLGYSATVFVVSGCVGGVNAWDVATGYLSLDLMDWDSLRRLQQQGWEIGGHTRSHPHLDRLSDAGAYAEILACKQAIEANLGIPASTFCYPYGDYRSSTPSLVRLAGFHGACTTRSGLARRQNDPFLQPRVKPYDGVAGLLYRILLRPWLPPVVRRQ
jgi:peptidoglycan/xylan/chitin deacetylase (PgdA/CDA1 family)